jgi:hypothetical protein
MSTDRTAAYCKYYAKQHGGEYPVFRGGQHGAGLGDILRGIFRVIAPVALRGISTFASSTLQARDKGASFKDAARSAIAPTFSAITDSFANQRQAGGAMQSTLFGGEHGVPFASTRAYKSGKKRKRTGSSASTGNKTHSKPRSKTSSASTGKPSSGKPKRKQRKLTGRSSTSEPSSYNF